MPLIYEDALTVAAALITQLLQSTKMLNHTKISTVSYAIIVLLFVQFLFIDYITGFMKDSQHERIKNNAVRREIAEKNGKARDLYMTRGNNDVIRREREVTGEQVSSSSPSPTPLPCPTGCSCYWQQWYLQLNCDGHTNATPLSLEINVYLTSVAWNLTKLTIRSIPLTAVPESICQLKQLQYLYLVDNNFKTSLPDNCFTRLQELEHFRAMLCRLTSLRNGLFANLTKLRYVYLSHNQISSIDAHLFDVTANLPNLHYIDLSHNNLTEIDTWPVRRAQLINGSNGSSINLRHNNISRFANSLG